MVMRTRRSFLRECCALSSLAYRAYGQDCMAADRMRLDNARDVYPLWPEGSMASPAYTSRRGRIVRVSAPGLHIIRPEHPNGAAVIIAAGGGYRHIAVAQEALPAAHWLASLGITAAILLYRLPDEGGMMEAPLADARQALSLLQSGLYNERIDAQRVALMGFSAGGHLAGLTALEAHTMPPALLMLLYPVTMVGPPFERTRTSRACLGDHSATREQIMRWSLPPHVGVHAPPLFLAYAADDSIVSPTQDEYLVQSYQRHHRPYEVHQFATGGHGFGLGRVTGPTQKWPHLAERWMRQQGFL